MTPIQLAPKGAARCCPAPARERPAGPRLPLSALPCPSRPPREGQRGVACGAASTVGSRATGSFMGKDEVPLLGLGLAALGRPGYINLGHGSDLGPNHSVEALRDHCCKVLDAALELNLQYIDVARSYGKSEEFLAHYLQTRILSARRSGLLVGSKWGYTYTADWQVDTQGGPHEVKQHTAANLATQQAETAHLLGDVDLYQIHSATLESGALSHDVVSGLIKLRDDRGWRLGLSLSGAEQAETLRAAMKIKVGGRPLFDAVQATWNLLEPSVGPALLEAREAGMDVIVKEAVGNGRLLTGDDNCCSWSGGASVLQREAVERGCDPDALAIACAIVQPFRPMVLSGAATVYQLQSNANALSVAENLDVDDANRLAMRAKQHPEAYWQERAAMIWN
ncbi:unnamed protein product [Pedinophyceae sp. YPF-701]|nr:unnamed protein product [Pedinophyceae sp. YPF-701]